MSPFGTPARFNCTSRYNRFKHLQTMLSTWLFHFRSGGKVRPSSFALCTTSNSFPFTRMGAKILFVFLKSILSSLHFSSWRRNELVSDQLSMIVTVSWIELWLNFGIFSDVVRSSTDFAWSLLVRVSSLIIKINSHGPSFVPFGTGTLTGTRNNWNAKFCKTCNAWVKPNFMSRHALL